MLRRLDPWAPNLLDVENGHDGYLYSRPFAIYRVNGTAVERRAG